MSHRRLAGRGLASIGLLALIAVAAAPASAVTKTVTEFKIKTANNQPGDMAVGTDGNVWFVDQNTSKVAQISKTGGITGYLTHTRQQQADRHHARPRRRDVVHRVGGQQDRPHQWQRAGDRLPDPDRSIEPARDHPGHRR